MRRIHRHLFRINPAAHKHSPPRPRRLHRRPDAPIRPLLGPIPARSRLPIHKHPPPIHDAPRHLPRLPLTPPPLTPAIPPRIPRSPLHPPPPSASPLLANVNALGAHPRRITLHKRAAPLIACTVHVTRLRRVTAPPKRVLMCQPPHCTHRARASGTPRAAGGAIRAASARGVALAWSASPSAASLLIAHPPSSVCPPTRPVQPHHRAT